MLRNPISAILFAVLVAGCASTPPGDAGDACVSPGPSDEDSQPRFIFGGWLLPDDARSKSLMTSSALDDEHHTWLWLDLDLGEARCARVEGRGALTLVLGTPDGEQRLRDEGIRVPLEDGNTFLNSAGGAISIRADGDSGAAGTVRLLVAVPGPIAREAKLLSVEPDDRLWRFRR